jgi:hypothetical protein
MTEKESSKELYEAEDKAEQGMELPETLNPERTRKDEEHGIDTGEEKEQLEMAKTKSIAETLSLPHEIAFVTVICMAQFMTRKSTPNLL